MCELNDYPDFLALDETYQLEVCGQADGHGVMAAMFYLHSNFLSIHIPHDLLMSYQVEHEHMVEITIGCKPKKARRNASKKMSLAQLKSNVGE